jgi:mono/diheme cytochrome c family protein
MDDPAGAAERARAGLSGAFPRVGPNRALFAMKMKFSALILLALPVVPALAAKEEAADPNQPVSFYKHVRPIFEAHCHGCHQPAKAKGDYVMTDFAKLLAGSTARRRWSPGSQTTATCSR